MERVQILWDPAGVELDSLGSTEVLRVTDGDTPYVSTSIRMLSIDAPEVHYPGRTRPSRHDEALAELGQWLQEGRVPCPDDLAEHLHPKLATGAAGTLQQTQGELATARFQELLAERLARPGRADRSVYVQAAEQAFDQYGRLLAYLAPKYSEEERAALSPRERATFNLLMVDSGWAASFPIYPSLPGHADLELLHAAARAALLERRGAWAEPLSLTGYEFRMCVRLHDVAKKLVGGKKVGGREREGWVERYCVDLTTREVFEPPAYHRVAPYNRLFLWPRDVGEAAGRLNLLPAGAG